MKIKLELPKSLCRHKTVHRLCVVTNS